MGHDIGKLQQQGEQGGKAGSSPRDQPACGPSHLPIREGGCNQLPRDAALFRHTQTRPRCRTSLSILVQKKRERFWFGLVSGVSPRLRTGFGEGQEGEGMDPLWYCLENVLSKGD